MTSEIICDETRGEVFEQGDLVVEKGHKKVVLVDVLFNNGHEFSGTVIVQDGRSKPGTYLRKLTCASYKLFKGEIKLKQ